MPPTKKTSSQKPETTTSQAIPLPSIGSFIGEAWSILSGRLSQFIFLKLIVLIPVVVLIIVIIAWTPILNTVNTAGGATELSVGQNVANIIFGILGIISIIGIVIFTFWSKTATIIYLRDYDKVHAIKPALKEAWPKLWGMIWVGVLQGLWILLGFILLIVPAAYFHIKYLFSPFIYILEYDKGKRGPGALSRGFEIINGYRWGVFARIIVAGLIAAAASMALQIGVSLIEFLAGLMGDGVAATIIGATLVVITVLISIVVNLVIQVYVEIFSFAVFTETYTRKIEHPKQDVYHPFSTIKKTVVGIIIVGFAFIPVLLFSAATIIGLNEVRVIARDTQTLSDVREIQTVIEQYRSVNEEYPRGQSIVIGQVGYECLQEGGFSSECEGSEFMFPELDEERGVYTYSQKLNGTDYELIFTLEGETDQYTAGKHTTTSEGIDFEVNSTVPLFHGGE